METPELGLHYRLRRALRQIARQHRQLRELGGGLEEALAGGARAAVRDAFVRYRHAVGAHFELEDGVFFPALHGLDPAQGEPLEELCRDHLSLLERLQGAAALLEAPALDAFRAALAAWRAALAAHERREEELVARVTGAG